MSSTKLIQAQAARYVTRLYSGELTAREERQLQQWRQQSAQHEAEFQAMLTTWDLTGNLFQSPKPSRRPGVRRGWWAVAASVALVGVLSWQWLQPQQGDPKTVVDSAPVIASTNASQAEPATTTPPALFRITEQRLETDVARYQTEVGEVSHVTLSDGSVVSLNTDTEVEVSLSANQRQVTLVRGEAFFNIARDESRPFQIDTGRKVIEVLGTQFNVRKRADETVIKVSVLEGRVAIKPTAPASTAAAKPDTADAEVTLLLAGDIGAYSESSEVVTQNQTQAVSSAQSWRQGVFRFDDESLEHVIREFNRYRSRKIVLADPSVADLRISGVFHLKNGDHILTALESTLPVQFDRSKQAVTVRRR